MREGRFRRVVKGTPRLTRLLTAVFPICVCVARMPACLAPSYRYASVVAMKWFLTLGVAGLAVGVLAVTSTLCGPDRMAALRDGVVLVEVNADADTDMSLGPVAFSLSPFPPPVPNWPSPFATRDAVPGVGMRRLGVDNMI